MAFPFVGGSYRARSSFLDSSETINLYPEISNKTATSKAIAALYGTPGLRLWKNFGSVGVRGLLPITLTLAIVVTGNQLSVVNIDGDIQFTGTIDGSSTPASMASNGEQIMIVTGSNGYFLDITVWPYTLTIITDPDFTGADTVQFINGYFVFNKSNTGEFQISGLYSTNINALDFATTEGAPDNLLAVLVDHKEVWLFGETTTEVWFNSGDVFPFAPIEGAFIEQGTAAKFTPVQMDNTVYWLGRDSHGENIVYRANGYQPVRVSTHAVEYAIASYSRTDDAIAYSYQQEGHKFYMLTFPSANVTWCYDSATDEWHKRAWRNPNNGSLDRHRSQNHMSFGGMNLVGDWSNGNVYVLDLDTYTDNGDVLPAIRQTPYMYADGRWIFFGTMYIDMEVGVGLSDGSDPQLIVDWADDGGLVFENEIMTSIGAIGENTLRVTLNRLGKSRGRVWKFTITDPVKRALIGIHVESKIGRF